MEAANKSSLASLELAHLIVAHWAVGEFVTQKQIMTAVRLNKAKECAVKDNIANGLGLSRETFTKDWNAADYSRSSIAASFFGRPNLSEENVPDLWDDALTLAKLCAQMKGLEIPRLPSIGQSPMQSIHDQMRGL